MIKWVLLSRHKQLSVLDQLHFCTFVSTCGSRGMFKWSLYQYLRVISHGIGSYIVWLKFSDLRISNCRCTPLKKIWFFGIKSRFFTWNPQQFSCLPPLGAIFLSAPPLIWNPGSVPEVYFVFTRNPDYFTNYIKLTATTI